jgi:FHS family L-fucose permease-like MFS transporter
MDEASGLDKEDGICFLDPAAAAGSAPRAPTRGSPSMALMALGSLYFIFGFITCLNDVLVPHLKSAFELNYTRAMFIQLSFFSAYFIVSLPSGRLVDRIGYQRGMVFGLAAMAGGCFLFLPAAGARSYPLFLGALFLLAAGVTLLQVAANPYVAVLGPPETASSRLTLTQGFNSLGTTLAPWFGSALILARAAQGAETDAVRLPYLILAAVLAGLALFTARLRMPPCAPAPAERLRSPWRHRPLLLGALGIFLYVGAEVGIGSFLVNYISQLGIEGITLAGAARYVSLYWGGAMVGRFLGSAAMRRLAPGRVLAGHALAAAGLVLAAMLTTGRASMCAILAVGLCNSIMFPTIFTLAIRGLDRDMGEASGILCMAVVGGALVPLAQGVLADLQGIRAAFILPLVCYAYIVYYGAAGHVPGPLAGPMPGEQRARL